MKYTGIYLSYLLLIAVIPRPSASTDVAPPSCASRCMVDSLFVTQCTDTTCLCHEKRYQKSLFQCLYAQCDAAQYGPALSHTIVTCLGTGSDIYMMMAAPLPGQEHADAGGDDVTKTDELLRRREAEYLAGRPQDQLPEVPGLLGLRQESVEPVPAPALPTPPAPPVGDCCVGGGVTKTATTTLVSTTTATIAYVPSATGAYAAGGGYHQYPDNPAANSVNSDRSGEPATAGAVVAGGDPDNGAAAENSMGTDAGTGTTVPTSSAPAMPPWLAHLSRSKTTRPRVSSWSSFAGLVLWVAAAVVQDIWFHPDSL